MPLPGRENIVGKFTVLRLFEHFGRLVLELFVVGEIGLNAVREIVSHTGNNSGNFFGQTVVAAYERGSHPSQQRTRNFIIRLPKLGQA
jgi:hypothetical protein